LAAAACLAAPVGSAAVVVPYILAICLCGVFCLLPLAIYLLWLSQVTRRERPTALSGAWDFAGVLLALSGFFAFGGGLLLSLLQSNFRYWMRGNFEGLRTAWVQERVAWSFIVLAYLFVVLGAVAVGFVARRRSLVVYNVEPAAFESLLNEVFQQLGRPVERVGKLWVSGDPLFELDAFAAGRTVTLRWVSPDERLHEEVARQLRAALAAHATADNPAGRWLTAAAVGLGALAGCSFGLLIYAYSLLR
jgi:hypothetical protein